MTNTRSEVVFEKWGIMSFVKTVFIVVLATALIWAFLYVFLATPIPSALFRMIATQGMNGSYEAMQICIIGTVLFALFICMSVVFNSALELNKAYVIGKRKQDDCGFEYTEASTGRYGLTLIYPEHASRIRNTVTAITYIYFVSVLLFVAVDAVELYYTLSDGASTADTRQQGFVLVLYILMCLSGPLLIGLTATNITGSGLFPFIAATSVIVLFVLRVIRSIVQTGYQYLTPVFAGYILVSVLLVIAHAFVYNKLKHLNDAMDAYWAHVYALQANIASLMNNKNYTEKIKKHIVRNIVRDDQVEGNEEYIYGIYSGKNQLWPYVTHRNWKELKEAG